MIASFIVTGKKSASGNFLAISFFDDADISSVSKSTTYLFNEKDAKKLFKEMETELNKIKKE